jgi:trehalose synthase
MEHIPKIEDYEQFVGAETVDRISEKAAKLSNAHIVHINATYYGGGVAELLGSSALLLNALGIKTGWRVIQGSPDFFATTKKIHNALQGGEINITERKLDLLEHVILENALRNHLDHDLVVIHDPQPLFMINHYRRRGPWVGFVTWT